MNFPWIHIKVKHKVICIHLFAQRVKYTHLFVLNKIMLWFNAAVILFWPLEATPCFCLLLCVAFAFLWLETGKSSESPTSSILPSLPSKLQKIKYICMIKSQQLHHYNKTYWTEGKMCCAGETVSNNNQCHYMSNCHFDMFYSIRWPRAQLRLHGLPVAAITEL